MVDINIGMGGGFMGLLTLVFVIAKLWGKIDWSWWWVFAPVWIPWAIILAIFILIGLYLLISEVF